MKAANNARLLGTLFARLSSVAVVVVTAGDDFGSEAAAKSRRLRLLTLAGDLRATHPKHQLRPPLGTHCCATTCARVSLRAERVFCPLAGLFEVGGERLWADSRRKVGRRAGGRAAHSHAICNSRGIRRQSIGERFVASARRQRASSVTLRENESRRKRRHRFVGQRARETADGRKLIARWRRVVRKAERVTVAVVGHYQLEAEGCSRPSAGQSLIGGEQRASRRQRTQSGGHERLEKPGRLERS